MKYTDRWYSRRYFKPLAVMALALVGALFWVTLNYLTSRQHSAGTELPASALPSPTSTRVALGASGRVEGASETVDIGAAIDGIISRLLVNEGEHVAKGQVLGNVWCEDLRAKMAGIEATVAARENERIRLVRGSRSEERRDASAQSEMARIELKHSETQFQRIKGLAEASISSTEALDFAKSNVDLSRARYASATEREKLINSAPLPEDVARIDAEIKAATMDALSMREKLEMCAVKAPFSGLVLRIYKKPGESVTTVLPQPILALVDDSKMRVRAEVDERDIARIYVGQPTWLRIDAFDSERFPGRVAFISRLMGKKKILSTDPADRRDRDVLDVLIDLDSKDARLVVGLRCTVQFLAHLSSERQPDHATPLPVFYHHKNGTNILTRPQYSV